MADLAPRAERPGMKDYGISKETEGLMNWAWAEDQLTRSRNYWVATTRADGRPHVAPVWGVWHDGALWFSTGGESVKGRNLAERPDAVVHLESGDDCVILEGRPERAAVPKAADEAYAAKYDGIRLAGEDPAGPAFRLRPAIAFGWLEKDYPNTATRWRFE